MSFFTEIFNNTFLHSTEYHYQKVLLDALLLLVVLSFIIYFISFIIFPNFYPIIVIICMSLSIFSFSHFINNKDMYISKALDNFKIESTQTTYLLDKKLKDIDDFVLNTYNLDDFIVGNKNISYIPYTTPFINENIEQPYVVVSIFNVEFVGKPNLFNAQSDIDFFVNYYNDYTIVEEVHY